MTLSVLIPFRNDYEHIDAVVKNIIDTAESDDYEILVYNDGSVLSSGKPRTLELDYKNTRVINASQSYGVGYAFDRLAEEAQGEYLVLTASDVFPHKGWYEKVRNEVSRNPNTIGCAVCVGDKPPYKEHWGADLLFTVSNDDLPKNSKLRERKGGYTNLFKARWLDRKWSDEPYEIPCLLGAFYFTSKAYYKHIGGFDTEKGNRYIGHKIYGHLEPYLSLKSWLVGGGCTLYPDIKATHLFGRIDGKNAAAKGGRSALWMFWNVLFILETQIMSEATRNRLYDHMHPELNWSEARKLIRQNYGNVERVREANRQRFTNTLKIFEDKFNYKI